MSTDFNLRIHPKSDTKEKPRFRGSWSEKRDSNSRPSPWQGDALPTELFSLVVFDVSNKYGCKIKDSGLIYKPNLKKNSSSISRVL
jgi:hypothetical protein